MKKHISTAIFLISIFLVCILVVNNPVSFTNMPDKKERQLNIQVTTIQSALPFALERAREWNSHAQLYHVGVAFVGVEEINCKKGTIVASFFVSDKENQVIGDADTKIRMRDSKIFNFSGGPPEQRSTSRSELNPKEWSIDISEALELAATAVGKEEYAKYDNPKVVIQCYQLSWYVILFSGTAGDKNIIYDPVAEVQINPETGRVLNVRRIKK